MGDGLTQDGDDSETRELVAGEAREVLLVLDADEAAAALEDLASRHRIVGTLPPRVVMAQVDGTALEEMRRDPRIRFVVEDLLPAELIAELTPDEEAFVSAFVLRRTSPPKSRVGEGLPWDAPGFQPPDPPPDMTTA